MAYNGPRGSGFIGLQQYLGLNRGAAQRMGDTLAQQVEQQGGAALGQINTLAQQAQARLGGQPTYTAPTSAAEAAQRAAEAKKYAEGISGELGSAADVSATEQAAAKAQQAAQFGTTDAGRSVLLGQQYGQSGYTQGGSMLDSFLAGRGGGARLEQANNAYGKLREFLGTARSNYATAANAARQNALGVSQQYGAYRPPAAAQPAPVAQPPRQPGLGRDPRGRRIPGSERK